MRLIYWAVDETFHQFPKRASFSEIEEDDYILYVGSLEPRKNISTLVKAYEKLRRDNQKIKTKLVLIGGESPLFADARLKIQDFKEDIVFKGFVSDDVLRAYYRKAKVVAYPSLYEGFGLPPLEAMASGAPVVTSNTSSIPEVVGDAALLVSPYDTDQLAETLAKVITNPQLQETMRQKGREQVRKFNWYRVARNILGVYYEVCSSAKGSGGKSHLSLSTWKTLVDKEKYYIEQSRMHACQSAALVTNPFLY